MIAFPNKLSKSSIQTDCESWNQRRQRVQKQDTMSKAFLQNMGKYSLAKKICLNGINTVWIGQVNQGKKKVVIKVTRKQELTQNEIFHLQKHKEALGQLKSSAFIAMIQVIQSEFFDYFVMEYACKGDLSQYLLVSNTYLKAQQKQKRFKWAQRVIYRVCLALKQIHQKGLIYRDLKPENILFDHDANLKLSDFGLVVSEGTVDNSLCGTPEYMAPERLQYQKLQWKIERSCDMWSLGVLMYEILNGELPYISDSPGQLLEQIFSSRPFFDKNFPKEGKKLINSLLQTNPSNRASIDEVLAHQFFDNLEKDFNLSEDEWFAQNVKQCEGHKGK